jgi:DNA cross-link repair 1A protein
MKTILDYFQRSEQKRKKQKFDEHECPVCFKKYWMEMNDFELHVNQCVEGTQELSCPICGSTASQDLEHHVQQCLETNSQHERILKSSNDQSRPVTLRDSMSTKKSKQDSEKENVKVIGEDLTSIPPASAAPKNVKSIKTCPWYKWIPNTKFTVDAFQYGAIPSCTVYFLSHFHADHYMGLSKSFCGIVYCSAITGRLVHSELRVPLDRICILPMNTPVTVEQCKVTLLDANHCPGAVIFLFEVPTGDTAIRVLHTGDFRASEFHWTHPLLEKRIDYLYLDTTYCNPSYSFPPQHRILEIVEEIVQKVLDGEHLREIFRDATVKNVFQNYHPPSKKHTLFLVGSYKIGKEKVFMAVSRKAKSKVYAQKE